MDFDGGSVKLHLNLHKEVKYKKLGDAWGTRVKVRIFGYHPPDETELANDDLPWAQGFTFTSRWFW